ncbi:MAG: S41 family peptidase [Pirellulaceae bacterium]
MNLKRWRFACIAGLIAVLNFNAAVVDADDQTPIIKMATSPAVSPDGKQIAFAWRGDVWLADTSGGKAVRVTDAPGSESQPAFSADGKQLAYVSDRNNGNQIFVINIEDGFGTPEQITFHSEGAKIEEWTSEGQLLINAQRDHFWRHADRLFVIDAQPRPFEHLQFDAAADHGRLSPDGSKILYTREGTQWWRKGYQGSQASQIWLFDVVSGEHEMIVSDGTGARYPLWNAEGNGFYFVSGRDGTFNVYSSDLKGKATQITHSKDDAVLFPAISRDGSTLVFQQLFDLYSLDLTKKNAKPQAIELQAAGDYFVETEVRETLSDASEAAFTNDGLEIVFVAGGNVWVMDTVFREPKQITNTPEMESFPIWGPDGKSILCVSDSNDQSDIWIAKRVDEDRYWWQNDSFTLTQLTDDSAIERGLLLAPTNDHVAFSKGEGELWMMDPDGQNPERLIQSWNIGTYDWAPDGKWLTYSQQDNEFNSDVWVMPIDGSIEPANISMHPDNEGNPVWSPDGKVIAFSGRRVGEESDIHFVYVTKSDDETTRRDRKLEEAIEKMKKNRKEKEAKKENGDKPKEDDKPKSDEPKSDDPKSDDPKSDKPKADEPTQDEPKEKAAEKPEDGEKKADEEKKVEVKIDFDGIGDRIRTVSIPDSSEFNLFWSHDSKKLAFTANIEGKQGLYTIEPPDEMQPKFLTASTGSNPRWLEKGDQIVWLANGVPASVTNNGQKSESYGFSARHQFDIAKKYEVAFDLCWREMRDTFYDGNMNNLNWSEIRRKYKSMAANAPDNSAFATVVNLMLGELNASHMGFFDRSGGGRNGNGGWSETTAHFGLRFDRDFNGPGWKVRDVIYGSPADQDRSRVEAGEVIIAIDGKEVDPAMEPTSVLNGPLDVDRVLKVQNADGETREVAIRPISFGAARGLLYEHWIRQNRAKVDELSDGKLGYMHIQGMNMPSFYRFERELFAVGNGKDGIVIDVRENGGGSTADHLLTILTQPVHALTIPRGGGVGYPQDRKVYASWHKPIVVLCNQNSFSNAEIFSHAVKSLERGHLVGVPTAGGVISTGGTGILDLGFIRKPFRAWYIAGTGQDMELNGAVPDHIIWPEPEEWPAGIDKQLDKAVEVLQDDVKEALENPGPELIPASQRPERKKRR